MSSEVSAAAAQKFLLVAEDEPAYATAYELKLGHAGYAVTLVKNGVEVLAAVQKHKPDLILLDLMMPVKDGFSTLQELKQNPEFADIPVVVTSNLGQEEDIKKAKDLGALDFLIKSNISLTELIGKIEGYLK